MLDKLVAALLAAALLFPLPGCATQGEEATETAIALSDAAITVDGTPISQSADARVYTGAEIVYYAAGQDETYGEGTAQDAHTAEEALAHTVLTITQPGVYRLSGTLSAGQVAVDLGEGAAEDPGAVVTLVLDGVDITCTVAPAIIFYQVYECGSADEAAATAAVDTSAAGANIIIADASVNNVTGSYVARIYQEGTTKKLHKYDGAFYSKMSMNVGGGAVGDGVLNLTADNEGLDSELHLTINGGVINITADNDGINTNENNVSVTTINGGQIFISGGHGAEGDGVDSNGYLVINGGSIVTLANEQTGDGGIDADGGIYLNGGTVIALGGRNDTPSGDSAQAYFDLTFARAVAADSTIEVEDSAGNTVISYTAPRSFSSATFSGAALQDGETYAVYVNGVQQQYTQAGGAMGFGGFGGQRPEGVDPENLPEGMTPGQPGRQPGNLDSSAAGATDFTLTPQTRSFMGVSDAVAPAEGGEAA